MPEALPESLTNRHRPRKRTRSPAGAASAPSVIMMPEPTPLPMPMTTATSVKDRTPVESGRHIMPPPISTMDGTAIARRP